MTVYNNPRADIGPSDYDRLRRPGAAIDAGYELVQLAGRKLGGPLSSVLRERCGTMIANYHGSGYLLTPDSPGAFEATAVGLILSRPAVDLSMPRDVLVQHRAAASEPIYITHRMLFTPAIGIKGAPVSLLIGMVPVARGYLVASAHHHVQSVRSLLADSPRHVKDVVLAYERIARADGATGHLMVFARRSLTDPECLKAMATRRAGTPRPGMTQRLGCLDAPKGASRAKAFLPVSEREIWEHVPWWGFDDGGVPSVAERLRRVEAYQPASPELIAEYQEYLSAQENPTDRV